MRDQVEKLLSLELYVVRETPMAVLVNEGPGSKDIWLPKSMVEVHSNHRRLKTIKIAESFALEKGLI